MARPVSGLAALSLFLIPAAGLADQPNADALSVQRGAYLATAADCTACHTAPGGPAFAGGLPISSPVGTIYASNITPSASAGIGDYSQDEFSRALRRGIRKDGAHLYPAMPYTSYRLLTDGDVDDLYNYFQHAVTAVDVRPPQTSLPFPMNIRLAMMAWNLLFLSNRRFVDDPHRSPEWNRGAYLANAAAHCDACHTPRGFLMQERSGQNLAGGQVGPWYAPNITSDPVSGIGGWTQQDLAVYLKTGVLRDHARAAGSMAEAVEHSFEHLTSADLNAIAAYILTIPPVHETSAQQSRFTYGAAGSQLAVSRGDVPVRSSTGATPTGAELFSSNCASCHAANGQGSKDGYYPSLYHNSATGLQNPNNLIATILFGVKRGPAYMPGFGGAKADPNQLGDADVATLANYVIAQYGRVGAPATQNDVATIRQGGPSSSLLLLARIGIAAGVFAIIFLMAAASLYFSRRQRRHFGA